MAPSPIVSCLQRSLKIHIALSTATTGSTEEKLNQARAVPKLRRVYELIRVKTRTEVSRRGLIIANRSPAAAAITKRCEMAAGAVSRYHQKSDRH